MFSRIADFTFVWSEEIERTQKILKHLTDRSLAQAVAPEHRTLGRLAWHITTTIGEMMERTGLKVAGPVPDSPAPSSAKEIFQAYNEAAISLLEQIQAGWKDDTLKVEDEMYGRKWTRAYTLTALILHQVHHRGEMIVLMRQAGLDVPGLFGPAKQEWALYGMQAPEV